VNNSEKILIIGESCIDTFRYGKCGRMCPEAPVPVFNPVRSTSNPGMATNVMNNVLSLGTDCDIITNDNWKNLRKIRYIDDKTNQMFIRVDESDDEVSRCNLGAFKDDLKKYGAIIVSDYCKGFLTEQDIQYICEQNSLVFLDTKKNLGPWCESATFIKINYYEYEKTKHLVSSSTLGKLIVTLGKDGCKYREQIFGVPEVEIKDSSGAGDTFIAAMACEYMKNGDVEKALIFANQCATKVVQKRGVTTV